MVEKMLNSLRKFHSEEELPLVVVKGDDLKQRLEKDPDFFYRATPVMAKELFELGYEYVLKLDCDQIITGDLDYVLNSKGWDVGTVLNFNRMDSQKYGVITVWDIGPNNYVNCGFVAMRNKEFVNEWHRLCFSDHFKNYRMWEQDLLNIMCYYFPFKHKIFDQFDKMNSYAAWHGLIAKSEWQNAVIMKDETSATGKRLILKPTKDKYVPQMLELKVLHWAGGKDEKKMHYRTRFSEEVIEYLDYLTGKDE